MERDCAGRVVFTPMVFAVSDFHGSLSSARRMGSGLHGRISTSLPIHALCRKIVYRSAHTHAVQVSQAVHHDQRT